MEQGDFIYRLREIEKQLGYSSEWTASVLFKALKKADYSIKEKTAFVLYCYGWNGHKRAALNKLEQAEECQAFLFNRGKQFIEQFDGLIFPCKKSFSKSGSHVWIKFLWNPVMTAGVSAHFNERVIPIGVEHSFDGYEAENGPDCWENVMTAPDHLDFDEVSLYLGESGKVYWFSYDGDSLGVAADHLLEFFSVRFSFAEDKHRYDDSAAWTFEDINAMRTYQERHRSLT